MPTNRPRLQVTLDEQTNGSLSLLAENSHQSKSAIAAKLIKQALELQEDLYLSRIAEERDTDQSVWIEDSDAIWE